MPVAAGKGCHLRRPAPPCATLYPPPHPRPAPPQSLCGAANEVIDATLSAAANKDPEDEPPLAVVAALYSDKTAGELTGVQQLGGSRLACRCNALGPRSAWCAHAAQRLCVLRLVFSLAAHWLLAVPSQ